MKPANSEPYDHMIKLLILGDSTVGKSALMNKFCENVFSTTHIATIGVDFKYKNIFCDDKKIKLQIWDTAGQEKFRSIMRTYYKGAMGIVLTYAVTDKKSFQNIENWLKQIQNNAAADVVIVLVGNKCDLKEREVTTEEGNEVANKFGLKFFETSAKEGTNVHEVFYHIASVIKEKLGDAPAKVMKVVLPGDVSTAPAGDSSTSAPIKLHKVDQQRDEKRVEEDGCKC